MSAAASGETDAIVRLPFAGLKVLDLSRVLAGPYCCALLGEAGASVVKVERPGAGDENRRWGDLWHGESLDFMNVNRNKRGITVNLQSGNGQKVSVSLLQTALSLMGSHAAVYLMTGKQPTRAGSGVSHLAPYGAYRARDSYVVIGTLNEETWHKLCRTLEHEDLMAEPRFANLHARVRHRRELDEILHGVFGAKTTAEWVDVFEEAGLVISPVNTLSEVMDHPQVVENGIIVSTQHPAGELKLVGAPMTFADWTLKPTSPPPLLGQHTNEVLQQLGYTLESIAALRSNGVI